MECQSVKMWKTAPAEGSAVICIAPFIGSSRALVHPHRREVSSLSRRVMLRPPVSVPLQDGLRFFPPPSRTAFGRPYGFPTFRGAYGLTTFRKVHKDG